LTLEEINALPLRNTKANALSLRGGIFTDYFKMSEDEYAKYVEKKSPNSNTTMDMIKSFITGGAICCLGQGLSLLYGSFLEADIAAGFTSVSLIFLGAFLTGLGVYDDIAKFGGAGTLVPITGFANAMVSPASEFRTEGLVTGTAAKMFVIAGPVIVYGVSASIVYGLVLYFFF
jgi:stage V sporulation protein AC